VHSILCLIGIVWDLYRRVPLDAAKSAAEVAGDHGTAAWSERSSIMTPGPAWSRMARRETALHRLVEVQSTRLGVR